MTKNHIKIPNRKRVWVAFILVNLLGVVALLGFALRGTL
ncbi:hypothetical protein COL8621_00886 [Actibacterium lipolyticum]|uniref:Uncharacterized protein n=1 Tax=Actibacterium lipolyticum TaxID=1524263 RepID=A0A238JRC1_9RHOB|nr:hypothetical protein COL8621_00886 [Actibacterium lipolyticum]